MRKTTHAIITALVAVSLTACPIRPKTEDTDDGADETTGQDERKPAPQPEPQQN